MCVCASINNVNDERRKGERKKRRSFFIVKVTGVGVRGSGQVKKRGREIGAGGVLSRKINYRPSVWPLTPYVSIVDPALVVFPRTVPAAHAFALRLPVSFFLWFVAPWDPRTDTLLPVHNRDNRIKVTSHFPISSPYGLLCPRPLTRSYTLCVCVCVCYTVNTVAGGRFRPRGLQNIMLVCVCVCVGGEARNIGQRRSSDERSNRFWSEFSHLSAIIVYYVSRGNIVPRNALRPSSASKRQSSITVD